MMIYRALTFAVAVACAGAACGTPPPERGEDVGADSAPPSGCPTGDPQRIPRIDVAAHSVNLVLPPAMTEVLERRAPGLVARPLTSFDPMIMDLADFGCDNQPSAVLADLNGDGVPDLAVLGRTPSEAMLVVLLSEGDGYRYLERDKRQLNPYEAESLDSDYFIHVVEPGRYTTRYEPEDPGVKPGAGDTYILDLAHAAIGWAYLEKAAGIVYWRAGRLWDFATAD